VKVPLDILDQWLAGPDEENSCCRCCHVGVTTRDGCEATPFCDSCAHDVVGVLIAEIDRLRTLLDTPHIDNFLEAVRVEAAHQVERWSAEHDEGKSPTDWFWLLGWLAGKAAHAAVKGDLPKALHHTISSAGVLLNWHAHLAGARTAMRPGIADPSGGGS